MVKAVLCWIIVVCWEDSGDFHFSILQSRFEAAAVGWLVKKRVPAGDAGTRTPKKHTSEWAG